MLIISVDTETTGSDFFNGCKPFLVGICDGEENTIFKGSVNPYTREVYWDDDELELLQKYLDRADVVIFHNTQFDMRALASIGIDISKIWDKFEDTLLCSHIFAPGDDHSLKHCGIKYLQRWPDNQKILEGLVKDERPRAARKGYRIAKMGDPCFPGLTKSTKWWALDMWLCEEECAEYLVDDIETTFLLWREFRVGLTHGQHWALYKKRKKLLKICYDITTRGMSLNKEKAEAYIASSEKKIELIRRYLQRQCGTRTNFNWDSKGHLTTLLHKYLNIPIMYTTDSGLPATDKDSLTAYAKKYPSKEIRALQKGRALSTKVTYCMGYLNWCDEDYRIHSNLNVTGTRESRQSSSGPNQQNITGILKELFEPRTGYIWLDIDFVNIEMRIWAYSTKNKELIAAFEKGQSVHHMIMETLYPTEYKRFQKDPDNLTLKKLYRNIKAGNFAIIYGATERKADETYGYKGATQKIYKRFPGIKEYTDSLITQCEENRINLGRHCVLTLGDYPLDVPVDEPYKACNYYTQGSAGMVMCEGLIAVVENPLYIKSQSQLITQVHDSAVPEIPLQKGMPEIAQSIVTSLETCVADIFGPTPVDYEIKYNPADKHNSNLHDLIAWADKTPF